MGDFLVKVFFDTEFTGLHRGTTLISIGMVSEDGRSFYAEFIDYDLSQVDRWIQMNVLNNLKWNERIEGYKANQVTFVEKDGCMEGFGVKSTVKVYLEQWLSQFDGVEFWNDCLSYDWVLLSDLLGPMVGVDPEDKYFYQESLCSLDEIKSVPYHVYREVFVDNDVRRHNSLYDAVLLRKCYIKLKKE